MEEKEAKPIGTDVNQIEITSLKHLNINSQIKELLKVNLDAYFNSRAKDPKNTSFGPLILLGPSGCGKTLVAKAIHAELGNLKLIDANGESLNNSSELMAALLTADENTTLFLDECQALNTKSQHILLTAISEKKIYAYRGNNKTKCSIPLANFTLILASTHEYQLQDALRNRMRICCRMDYYTPEELAMIVKQRADALQWKYELPEVMKEISLRAKQTPRIAINRNLQMAKNISLANDRDIIMMQDVLQAFKLLQVDSLGLDSLERAYLQELFKCGGCKLNILSSRIGLPRHTISEVIEPYLIRIGLVEKQGSNRVITEKGKEHIQNVQL